MSPCVTIGHHGSLGSKDEIATAIARCAGCLGDRIAIGERYDYQYQRNGTANLFMLFAPLEGWRHVKVTDRRTAVDFAHVLKDLSDTHFASAEKIVLAQDDNLNTHAPASLYEAFPPAEARRLVERFEWHYTPKHGSWLDMAEFGARRAVRAMPQPTHPRPANARTRGHGLAPAAQRRPRQGPTGASQPQTPASS